MKSTFRYSLFTLHYQLINDFPKNLPQSLFISDSHWDINLLYTFLNNKRPYIRRKSELMRPFEIRCGAGFDGECGNDFIRHHKVDSHRVSLTEIFILRRKIFRSRAACERGGKTAPREEYSGEDEQ